MWAFPLEENPPTLAAGASAPDFALPGVDGGKTYHLDDFAGSKVLVIVFTCDHCPTAQLYEDRIKKLAADYRDHKGRVRWLPKGDAVGQAYFVASLFGIAA